MITSEELRKLAAEDWARINSQENYTPPPIDENNLPSNFPMVPPTEYTSPKVKPESDDCYGDLHDVQKLPLYKHSPLHTPGPIPSSSSNSFFTADNNVMIGGAALGITENLCISVASNLVCPGELIIGGLTAAYVVGKEIINRLFKREIVKSIKHLSDINVDFSAEFDWTNGEFTVYEDESLVKHTDQQVSQEIAKVLNSHIKYQETNPLKISSYKKNDNIIIKAQFMEKLLNGSLKSHSINSSTSKNDKPEEIWSLFFHFRPEDFKTYSESSDNFKLLASNDVLTQAINDYILSNKASSICTRIPTPHGKSISIQIDVNKELDDLDLCF